MLCNSEVLKACAQSAKPMLSRTVALLNHLTLVPMPPPANEQPDVINNGQYYWNLSVYYLCFVISKIKQSFVIENPLRSCILKFYLVFCVWLDKLILWLVSLSLNFVWFKTDKETFNIPQGNFK